MSTPNSIPASSRSGEDLAQRDVERQRLIDNIAFLVVRWHRRRQQDSSDSASQDRSVAETCHDGSHAKPPG